MLLKRKLTTSMGTAAFVLAMALLPQSANAQTVTTLAGLAGSSGSADGTGSAARFRSPLGVAVDGSGNVYVADSQNASIRRVSPAGVVTTLAGLALSPGSVDGTGSAARFETPYGTAVDASGNVYVADAGSRSIRKVTPAGVVTTIAGLAGNIGNVDGTGSAARFFLPTGVAVDAAGNIFVADQYNNNIRKVTPVGVVTTLAGNYQGSADGTGGVARFFYPTGVAVDASGYVYVADSANHTIRKVTPAGVVTTLAGTAGSSGSADGSGSSARFNWPSGVAVDSSGNLYVADSANNTIRKVTPAGVVTTLAGLAASAGSVDGTGSAARFYGPFGTAVDASGNVYVGDAGNYTMRKVTQSVGTCPGTATGYTLPLVGGRFTVTLAYAGYPPNAPQGSGTGHVLADNVGYFGTVDPNSADVVVKIVDFCSLNNSWSVYIGGTTDINTLVSITDTRTGHVSQPFVNGLGHDFQLIKAPVFSCP